MKIREAMLGDSAALAPLLREYVVDSVSKRRSVEISECAAWIEVRLQNGDGVYFVATDAEEMIGFAALYPLFDSIALNRQWALNDLFVLSERRGRGVAKRLLEAVHAYARQSGANYIELETAETNEGARHLYHSFGYYRSEQYLRLYMDLQ